MLLEIFASVLLASNLAQSLPSALHRRQSPGITLNGDPASIASDNGEYIRVDRMTGGSLISGYTAHEGCESILRTAHSTDNGATWSAFGEVYRRNSSTSFLDNAFPLQIPGGGLLFAYRNHDTDPGPDCNTPGAIITTRISVSYSDDGINWVPHSDVEVRPYTADNPNGVWEPFLRIAGDGSIQAYYSSENSKADQDSIMRISQDGGLTWSDPPILVSGGDGLISRDGMTGVASIDGGSNLVCVFETDEFSSEGWTGLTVGSVVSTDDGQTWGNRSYVYRPDNKQSAGAPQVINVGGTLVTSFSTDESSPGGVDNGDMKVVLSTDGGSSWSGSFLVGPANAAWPGLFTLDDSSFLGLYSENAVQPLSQHVSLA